MAQQHYSRKKNAQTVVLNDGNLHDGKITASPVLALFFGVVGTATCITSNVWQVYTTNTGFQQMILDTTGFFGFLNMLPQNRASANKGLINPLCWFLAIAIQLGVAFFSLRATREFRQQLSHADGNTAERVWHAAKATTVEIMHNKDFFFYYGLVCLAMDGLGDYAFVTTLTGNVIFLALYGLILMATSTIMFALATEWLWIGIEGFINAWAQANARARRSGSSGGGN